MTRNQPPTTPVAGVDRPDVREALIAVAKAEVWQQVPDGTSKTLTDALSQPTAAAGDLREIIVDTMLNDGPEDTVYTVADRIVERVRVAGDRSEAVRAAALAVVEAQEAVRDAINGQGHPGEEHDRVLHDESYCNPPEYHVYSDSTDCAACGGSWYGAEDDLNRATGRLRAALGLEVRPWEYADEEHETTDEQLRAALAAEPAARDEGGEDHILRDPSRSRTIRIGEPQP